MDADRYESVASPPTSVLRCQVWAALTDGAITPAYYIGFAAEFDLTPGAPYRYSAGGGDVITGKVVSVEPGRNSSPRSTASVAAPGRFGDRSEPWEEEALECCAVVCVLRPGARLDAEEVGAVRRRPAGGEVERLDVRD